MPKSAPNKVYIIGHKSPDCDSIVSAIAYAEIKNALAGWESAHACASQDAPGGASLRVHPARPGPVNHETATVLSSFGFEAPQFVPNVYPQVSDVQFDKPMLVPEGAPLRDVWRGMLDAKSATACIIDPDGRLSGLATLGDIARPSFTLRHKKTAIRSLWQILVKVLGAEVLAEGQPEFDGRVFVGDIGVDWAETP